MAYNGLAKRSAEVRHLRQQWASWRVGQFPSADVAKAYCPPVPNGYVRAVLVLFFLVQAKSQRFRDFINIQRPLV